MVVLAAVCAVAAAVSAMFVRDTRIAGPSFAPPAPYHGCALPDPRPDVASGRTSLVTASRTEPS
jgi:hypothetical protein